MLSRPGSPVGKCSDILFRLDIFKCDKITQIFVLTKMHTKCMFTQMDTCRQIKKNLSAEMLRQSKKPFDITRATDLTARQVKQVLSDEKISPKINLQHIVAICDYLDVSIDEMLGRDRSRTMKVAKIKKQIFEYRDLRKQRDTDLSTKADVLFKLINDLH